VPPLTIFVGLASVVFSVAVWLAFCAVCAFHAMLFDVLVSDAVPKYCCFVKLFC
jgi:hypothetical protein